MLDLYREQILERSRSPRHSGTVPQATHRAEGANQACGDEIRFEILVEDGRVSSMRHSTRACSICTASADLITEAMLGKPVAELEHWTTERVRESIGIPLSPTRLKCALLPLETIKEALRS
jgi:nitrogen fixation protein NifU and related proteins